ncbi:hypothetical protein PR001_g21460 [Phytophthora rubi]|uniref:Uncharacterized protein n=1 Tax=Phytophthora rubi TaxID=129364 RepID=A0A6A3J7R5_9STRA|nr:hypothetical protein PR001_g21460 [Phytophthora rubi]
MEMRIANFVYESGSAFRIVELPSFTFMMNGANRVLTIPSAKKSHGEKPLPPVVYNLATLGDDPIIENVPSVYFDADDSDDDDDDDDVSSSSDDEDFDEDADDEDSEEVNSAARAEQDIVIQEPLDYFIDNSYDHLGEQ